MHTSTGLRERKKAATRSALSVAALSLVVERGLNVTAEAIAAAANVSLRTFHNYFSTKEEAISAAFLGYFSVFVAALHERPADEPILDSVEHVARWFVGDQEPGAPAGIRREELMRANRALMDLRLGVFDEIEQQFAEVIADRLGTDVGEDLYPGLLAAFTCAAIRHALRMHELGRIDADLPELVSESFAQVRRGMPQPAHRATAPPRA